MREERAMADQAVSTQSLTSADTQSPAGSRAPALDELIAQQEEIFCERQHESRRLAARAEQALAGGVTSSWQITRPQPVWLSHGKGSKIYDVDGNEYVDLHGGYGAAMAGHGHPAIVEAVRGQAALGTHFAQPTPAAILVAEQLTRRFGLPLWRFANSGTEATMDAVHLMRAITHRDLIIKVAGCYHGHHPRGRLHRPGWRRPAAGRVPRQDRRDAYRADHDERRDHHARAGLPGRPEGAAALPGGPAGLR